MTDLVLFDVFETDNAKKIGVITLNSEKTLNALNLHMVDLILTQLEYWQQQETVVCVLLKGSGAKAFCAGGDVQALYQSAIENPGGPCLYAEQFFQREYRLNYLLHTYSKPVICWGHGIVMGGGLGLMAACSHRVATEKTRIAMPEISIGLYPDVGGSWFLNKMPAACGIFLALTGASINCADSLYTQLANYVIKHDCYSELIKKLLKQAWSTDSQFNHHLLSELLASCAEHDDEVIPAGKIEKHHRMIRQLCCGRDPIEIIKAIENVSSDDDWLLKARDNLLAGSPLSALIIFHQLHISEHMSLQQVFQSELQLSTNVVRYPEFSEGVRALLIDKDRNPQWVFNNASEVDSVLLDTFFIAPQVGACWPKNPLADL